MFESIGPVAELGDAFTVSTRHSAAASAIGGSRLPLSSRKMPACFAMSPMSCIAEIETQTDQGTLL